MSEKPHWADKQNLQDWVTPLIGAWIFASPWAIPYVVAGDVPGTKLDAAAALTVISSAAAWDHWLIGLALFVLGIAAVVAHRVWEEWASVALGILLAVSPWVLGFTNIPGLTLNAVIAGAAVAVLSGSVLLMNSSPSSAVPRARVIRPGEPIQPTASV